MLDQFRPIQTNSDFQGGSRSRMHVLVFGIMIIIISTIIIIINIGTNSGRRSIFHYCVSWPRWLIISDHCWHMYILFINQFRVDLVLVPTEYRPRQLTISDQFRVEVILVLAYSDEPTQPTNSGSISDEQHRRVSIVGQLRPIQMKIQGGSRSRTNSITGSLASIGRAAVHRGSIIDIARHHHHHHHRHHHHHIFHHHHHHHPRIFFINTAGLITNHHHHGQPGLVVGHQHHSLSMAIMFS